MGSFYTTGWLSHLQLKYNDEIFAMICIAKGNRVESQNIDPHREEPPYRPYGKLTPVCLPIFGHYDDYGSIHDIQHNAVVKQIEDFFDTDIETIVEVLDDVTTIFRCHYKCDETTKKLELYESFRNRLGLNADYWSTYEPDMHKTYDMHIVLVMDRMDVYNAAIEKMRDVSYRGLLLSRKDYSEDNNVRERWSKVYDERFGDLIDDDMYERHFDLTPNYLTKTRDGIMYNGFKNWWELFLLYKDPLQVDSNGKYIYAFEPIYNQTKTSNNLEALLYNESIENELVDFIAFLIFLNNAYIEIGYSSPSGQDDINDLVVKFHKAVGDFKVELY